MMLPPDNTAHAADQRRRQGRRRAEKGEEAEGRTHRPRTRRQSGRGREKGRKAEKGREGREVAPAAPKRAIAQAAAIVLVVTHSAALLGRRSIVVAERGAAHGRHAVTPTNALAHRRHHVGWRVLEVIVRELEQGELAQLGERGRDGASEEVGVEREAGRVV